MSLAARIHEELAVYERLGDERSAAIAIAKVADILLARGQFDEALRSLRGEVLPVFVKLNDVQSHAATLSRLAEVSQARGQFDDALRSLEDEVLPVYERLGDQLERALTIGKIADILEARGQYDEPLRIRLHEELPVYTRLGDARAHAITQGKVGSQLAQGSAERERGAALMKEALASLRAMKLPEADKLAGQMKALAIPTKRKRRPVDDGWTSFEGDFNLADLRAASRSGHPIPCLSIRGTLLTQRKSQALRGMQAEWLSLGDVTRAAMREVLVIKGLRVLAARHPSRRRTQPRRSGHRRPDPAHAVAEARLARRRSSVARTAADARVEARVVAELNPGHGRRDWARQLGCSADGIGTTAMGHSPQVPRSTSASSAA